MVLQHQLIPSPCCSSQLMPPIHVPVRSLMKCVYANTTEEDHEHLLVIYRRHKLKLAELQWQRATLLQQYHEATGQYMAMHQEPRTAEQEHDLIERYDLYQCTMALYDGHGQETATCTAACESQV